MIRYDHYTDKFVKVSDKECPWCKAVCASTDKYCHECGWHIADTPQTDRLVTEYPQNGEVNLIGKDKTEAVVMAYDVYKELTEPQTERSKR